MIIGLEIRQWAWHQQNILILYMVWKWEKSEYKYAYYPYEIILNYIWFLSLYNRYILHLGKNSLSINVLQNEKLYENSVISLVFKNRNKYF